MKRYEYIDHTADIVVRAYGDSLEESYAAAGDALFETITGGTDIRPEREIRFEVESIDREGLLVSFLSNLLVTFEVDGLVLSEFTIRLTDERHLVAEAMGEFFDEARHCQGYHVKGVSYHMLEIEDGDGGKPSHVQVLFDI